MKKLLNYSLAMLMAIIALTSCSFSGSKEITLNDVRCNADYISVVPGNYTINWKTEHQGNNGFVTAKITLKIKIEKQLEYTGKERGYSPMALRSFDANGNFIGWFEIKSTDYTDSNGGFTPDDPEALNAAIDDFTKPVGTISEITFSSYNVNGDAEKLFSSIEYFDVQVNTRDYKPKGE